MPPNFRVMFYVQHLLGIGHLQRALQLAASMAARQLEVMLVSGGVPQALPLPEGVRLQQLPPVYCADGSFSSLLDNDGNEIDEAWRQSRRRQLLELFESQSPHALITETFPFGRRMMRFELIPLLQMARRNSIRVQVISSIRDILQPKSKPGRNEEICDLVDNYYDHVLVHGDPSIARLEDSFELATRINDKICYSGYIAGDGAASPPGAEGRDEVLVSAGGSATGLDLLETAIAARPLTSLAHHRWRILVSPAIDQASFRQLRRQAGEGIVVERNRADFTGLMRRARLSISQAGYNTLTDILGSGAAAVVVPYADADQLEQTLRARLLQRYGRVAMLEQERLSPASLAAALEQALDLDTSIAVDLDGANNSAGIISRWLRDSTA